MKMVSYIPHGTVPDVRGFAPAIAAYNLTKNLKSFTAFTICNQEDLKVKFEDNEEIGEVYRIKEGRVYRRLFRKITRIDPWPLHSRAASIVNRILPDIFHAHQLEFPVNDFLERLDKKIPVVVHAHVTCRRFEDSDGVAHRYFAVSNHVREKMVENGYPGDRIEVIRNGVDLALFSPAKKDEKRALRDALNIPEDAAILTFVGRLQEVKGFHVFLQVAEVLLRRYGNLRVLVVGPEPNDAKREGTYKLRRELREKLSKEFGARYMELPPQTHDRLPDIFKVSDISLLPSLYESQGMAVVESMAAGCVTISTDVGGVKESIIHGETGFLVENPGSLKEVLSLSERVIEDIEGLDYVRARAREFAVKNFNWENSASKVERTYLELLKA